MIYYRFNDKHIFINSDFNVKISICIGSKKIVNGLSEIDKNVTYIMTIK